MCAVALSGPLTPCAKGAVQTYREGIGVTHVLGVDPGVTTGLCAYDTEEDRLWYPGYHGLLGPKDHHEDLEYLIAEYEFDVVACEEFKHRRVDKAILTSVEYIGVVKLAEQKTPTLTAVFQPVMKGKKGLWTDDKLKALDIYHPGKDGEHINDATRQCLFYLTTVMQDYTWINRYGNTQGYR